MCTHVAAALLACPYCQRYDPAVVVYYCGTNDAIHPPGRPAQEIADGFYAFVDAVHALAGERGGAGRRPPHIIYLCPVASQFHQVRTGVAHAHTRARPRATVPAHATGHVLTCAEPRFAALLAVFAATSAGYFWPRAGRVCIISADRVQTAFCRPAGCVCCHKRWLFLAAC